MTVTVLEMQAAFTEWDRMWRENPEDFESLAVTLLKGNPESYGESAAPFFVEMIKKTRKAAQ
jgi:hypothetical protein